MKWINTLLAAVLIAVFASGCSGSNGNPAIPGTDLNPVMGDNHGANYSAPTLMGYYDVYIDPEAEIVEVIPNRNTEFLLNIVRFLNNNPLGIQLGNFVIQNKGTYFYIGLDWGIKHPAPVSPDLDVYDMRGVIVFDGSGALDYNADLTYGIRGTDQVMVNADGYTRWFNKHEFTTPGFGGYTQGTLAFDTMNCEGTFNPYMYYADGLGVADDLYPWLVANDAGHGTYTAGATLTRRMEFEFPIPTPGIKFGYAIFAAWEDVGVITNTVEAVACHVDVTDDIYYTGSVGGGSLILDISLFGWIEDPSAIFVESTVLNAPYELTGAEMTPVDSDDYWATYHTTIPSDSVTSVAGQEFWVVAEYAGYNYISPFGIPNSAGTDTLAAGFRFDLYVADTQYNQPPVIHSGVDGEDEVYVDSDEQYSVTATDPDMDSLTYYWWVTYSGETTVLYDGPGNGGGLFDIDFAAELSASLDDQFEINCEVSDPTHQVEAQMLLVTVVETPNEPPVVYGGVFGPASAGEDSVFDYSVSVNDPEGDPLTFSWVVTDIIAHVIKFTGPGDGAGILTLDWANDVGAVLGKTYGIDCSISDGINDPVFANILMVEINNQPPELISGVDGDTDANPTDVKVYTVDVVDPEGDPITYYWEVIDPSDFTTVFDGAGDGAGSFTVDWAGDVGAASTETYLITCTYNDPTHSDLKALPLIVLIL